MWFSFEARNKWWQMQEKVAWSCNGDGEGIVEGSTVIGWLCCLYLSLPVNLFFPKGIAFWFS